MIRKSYLSIIVAGERSQTFHKVTLSTITLGSILVAILAFFVGSVFMFHTYMNAQIRVKELSDLKRENVYLKERLNEFDDSYDRISGRVAAVRNMDQQLRTLTAVKDGSDDRQLFGVGGPSSEDTPLGELGRRHNELTTSVAEELDRLLAVSRREGESLTELMSYLEEQKNVMDCTPAVWPTKGFLTSKFGMRWGRLHAGIDIANKVGTVILAPADGTVIFVGVKQGYGNFMTICHGYGITTNYGHLYSVLVKVGDKVKRGDRIATVGTSGRVTGPHLHYEVQLNGMHVDPLYYILN
jgi:murein DD-endopeptidase MepM/ murein hydrolase activator NlpD